MGKLNINTIKQALSAVLSNYPLAFAYVFGSVVTGHIHQDSDVDIALGFSRAVGDEVFYEIFNRLYSRLGIASEKLDLKNFAELPLTVRFRVIRDGKLIYLKDQKIHRDMAARTLGFYHDHYPVMKKFNQLFLKQTSRVWAI